MGPPHAYDAAARDRRDAAPLQDETNVWNP